MNNVIKDLTLGNPKKMLWLYSLPMFISVIFQQIYNIADSVIVGKFVGEDALAAVGASYPITMLFMAVAVGSNIGCSVIISQYFGAKKIGRLKTAVSTIFISTAVISGVLTILGVLLSGVFMKIVNTPENIFDSGNIYLKIYNGGFIFLYFYNVATGIFNSLGDSKTPLYFLIGSSVGNIVLDLVFVIVFKMEVAGAAAATVIAQGVACILALITLKFRISAIKTNEQSEKFSWDMFKNISRIAVPSILQQSFISIGNLFIQVMVNGFGSSVIAGYSAAVKLNTFTVTSFTTLGNGVSGFTAQNVGAGKLDRVREGFKGGFMLAALLAIVSFIIFFFFGDWAIGLFMEEGGGTKALETGKMFLKIVSPFYIVVCAKLTADGVLRGAGAMGCFMVATFTDLILRVVISFILSRVMGEVGIWLSWPIGWSIATVMSLFFYLSGKWKKDFALE
jgi:putative MATE family efflux protein